MSDADVAALAGSPAVLTDPRPDGILEGEVITDAAPGDARVRVVIPAFSAEHRFDCRFAPRVGTSGLFYPHAGDKCVVVLPLDGAEEGWLGDWTPTATTPDVDFDITFADIDDPELSAIAALSSAADRLPYFTGVGTAALATLTPFGRTLIAAADAAAARAVTGAQASDVELSAIAGLTSAADRLPYFTGSGTAALATFTAAARALLDDVDAAAMRATLGAQASDVELDALAALTSAADRLPYFSGSGAASLATFTAFARSLLDDADASAALTTLGISTFIKTLLDDGDAATARATLGIAWTYAEVLADQSRSSATWGDPATAGPSVAITVVANALVQIFVEVEMRFAAGGGPTALVGVHEATDNPIDGTASSQASCIFEDNASSFNVQRSRPHLTATNAAGQRASGGPMRSGLITIPATAGTRTYKLVYASSTGAAANFRNRKLWARAI